MNSKEIIGSSFHKVSKNRLSRFGSSSGFYILNPQSKLPPGGKKKGSTGFSLQKKQDPKGE